MSFIPNQNRTLLQNNENNSLKMSKISQKAENFKTYIYLDKKEINIDGKEIMKSNKF